MPPALTARRHAKGFVLVAVLWMGVALLIAVSAYLATARSGALTARADVEMLRATELARSGLNAGLARLALTVTDDEAVPRDGTPQIMRFAEGEVILRIEDESGKLDINAAPAELLAPALRRVGSGADAFDAANMAQAIVQTREAGRVYGSVDALVTQFNLSTASGERIRQTFTTLNMTPRIDPGSAPADVLLSLPGVGESDVQDVLARRAAGLTPPRLGAAAVWLAPRTGPVFRMTAEAVLTSGIRARMEMVVAAKGLGFRGGRMDYDILSARVLP
ncbi:hypothetical protein AADZ90_001090 [Aestuariibius sp. 2305UL40-4]|uniref:hypothetical protein n=1 Tax=Aestuariibius violaceus TaxID=3234132 RepID=UPI00345E26FF